MALVLFVLAFCLGIETESYGIRPTDDAKTIGMVATPLEIHSKKSGWGELPCIAITPEFAYVAYDAREGYQSHVYLARIVAIAMDDDGTVWVAWTSYRDRGWAIRARSVKDMVASPEVVLAEGEGFTSQVRAASDDGTIWFIWVEWVDGVHRLMARTSEGAPGGTMTLYESPNPVARPDLVVSGAGRVAFTWDEYVDKRFVIRLREMADGKLGSVEDLCGEVHAHSWEPHIAGSGEDLLVAWHRVPGGGVDCFPAAAVPERVTLETGIGRSGDRETWRVRCFTDPGGDTWIAWLTRTMYRNTRLFVRRITAATMSEVCIVDMPYIDPPGEDPGRKLRFVNWLDIECDGTVMLAGELSGSIYLFEFDLPVLKNAGFPEGTSEEPVAEMKGLPQPPEPIDYRTDFEGQHLQVYFGDHHNHTSFSDGRAYPDMVMALGRDYRGFDYLCVTDHDITLTPGEFAWSRAVADRLTEDGTYVCLQGYEPSKGWAQAGFGHWNMLYPDQGDVFQFEEGMTPRALYAYAKEHNAILVPHHIGIKFAPHSWDYFDAAAEPVVELCSVHGIFETYRGQEDEPDMVEGKFIDDGLDRGYRFGFVGASDFHNPFGALTSEAGITGFYATSLTKDAIFEAMRKRRTFALTGSRIVVDFRCNGRFMGEEVVGASRLAFTGHTASPDSIVSVEIISARQVVFQETGRWPEVSFDWEIAAPDSEAYYYLRVRTPKDDYAWSSPIWTVPAK
jgi:hypothetical protein